MKKLFIGGLLLAGIVAFAGTCTLQHYQLTKIGTHDTYAGEIHNDTGTNFLQHKIVVAFVDPDGAVVETKTVTPCLRSLQNGAYSFFSLASTEPAANTSIGLAKLELGSSLKVGDAATGDVQLSNIVITRKGAALRVRGTIKNLDDTTLTDPNVCVVVYSSDGKVLVVAGPDTTVHDLTTSGTNASDTFDITVTALDSTAKVDHVDIWADGLKDDVPIVPESDLDNSVTVCSATVTPTPSNSPTSTPTGTLTPTNTPAPTNTPTATSTGTITASPTATATSTCNY